METKNNGNNKNAFVLKGIVTEEPIHVGGDYYEFELSVERSSGAQDVLRVMYDNNSFEQETIDLIKKGEKIGVMGRMLVYYSSIGYRKNKANIRALATSIGHMEGSSDFINEVYFEGFIAKPPVCRLTPKGRRIADIVVSTMSNDHVSYVPCIVWGRGTKIVASAKRGDFVSVAGRFQSREYNKVLEDGTVEVRTAYEVSAFDLDIIDIHPSALSEIR